MATCNHLDEVLTRFRLDKVLGAAISSERNVGVGMGT